MRKCWRLTAILLTIVLLTAAGQTACVKKKFTVGFELCGGTGSIASQKVKLNETAARPETDPMRTGYVFDGWFTAETGGEVYDFKAEVTQNITLYARWKANTYTVTFKVDGVTYGTPQTVEYGKGAAAPGTPTKASSAQYEYTFKEWDKAFDNVTEDLTVNAVFDTEEREYTVTFKVDGVTYGTPQTVKYGQGATAPGTPTKTSTDQNHYTFSAWDKAFNNVTADLTVNAVFDTELREYTVTFKIDGAIYGTPQTVPYGGRADEPAEPDDPAYVFVGWYTQLSGGLEYTFPQVTGDVTLHAHTVTAHYIRFDLNGAEGDIPDQKVGQGLTAVKPADPENGDGSIFAGWYSEAAGGQKYSFSALVSDSFTLYAHWGAAYAEDKLIGIPEWPWTAITGDYADSLVLRWSGTGETAYGVFSLNGEVTKEGNGKSVKVNMNGTLPTAPDGGHFLGYYISGLSAGSQYTFSFWMKSDAFQCEGMHVSGNWFDSTTAMTAFAITEYPSEWTKVEVVFVAAPNTYGLSGIIISFQQGTVNGGSGILYMDELAVAEYVPESPYLEERIAGIGERGWGAIGENFADKLYYQWFETAESSGSVLSLTGEETYSGSGQAIKANLSATTPTSGHHDLFYYVSGLTAGAAYKYSFRVKTTEGFKASSVLFMRSWADGSSFDHFIYMADSKIGSDTTADSYIGAFSDFSDWTYLEVIFTAAPNAAGLDLIHIAFNLSPTDNGGALYIDELELAEYVQEGPLYAEDQLTDIPEGPGYNGSQPSYADALTLWWSGTAETSNGVFSLTNAETKEGYGKSVKVNANAISPSGGEHFLDYYISGLTASAAYEFSFWIKSDGFDMPSVGVIGDQWSNSSQVTTISITEYPSSWTKYSVVFTANPDGNGLCLVLFCFTTSAENAGAGILYIDEIAVTPVS